MLPAYEAWLVGNRADRGIKLSPPVPTMNSLVPLALACPEAEIIIVEPEGWDDMGRSLRGGEIVPVAADAPPTRCDALQTPLVSTITFDVLRACFSSLTPS